jgi:hypothetical protein
MVIIVVRDKHQTDFRRNMEDGAQHQLATEMDISLMKAHLRLDIDQITSKEINESFQRVMTVEHN